MEATDTRGRDRPSEKPRVLIGTSKMTLSIPPRPYPGTFDPKLIAIDDQRCFPDFDEVFISMYARGMSSALVRGYLELLLGPKPSKEAGGHGTELSYGTICRWVGRSRARVQPEAPPHLAGAT